MATGPNTTAAVRLNDAPRPIDGWLLLRYGRARGTRIAREATNESARSSRRSQHGITARGVGRAPRPAGSGGECEAFEALARKYIRSVYAVVSSFLSGQEDIDDSVQETFLRALEKIQSFDPRRPFAPWLYQIARNVARSRWKYLKSRQHEDLTEFERLPAETQGDDPGTLAESSELRRYLAAAIDSLPERQRDRLSPA